MKTIMTSNYARKGGDANSVAISCTVPPWYEGTVMAILAPMWNNVKNVRQGNITIEYFNNLYINTLLERKLTPESILEIIPNNSILLCYESPGKSCHRRTLAAWLEQHTGIIIPEWMNDKETRQKGQENVVDSLVDF